MGYRLLILVVCTGAVGAVMAADQMPHHKAGLWEITVALGSQKPGHEKICLDDATEKLMYKMGSGMSQKMCSQVSMHSSTSQLTVDATGPRFAPESSEVHSHGKGGRCAPRGDG
jgi:hypothetical protein